MIAGWCRWLGAGFLILAGCQLASGIAGMQFGGSSAGGGAGTGAGGGATGGVGGEAAGGTGSSTGGSPLPCADASECPAPSDFCHKPVCDDGACIEVPNHIGIALPAPEQPAGDCREKLCDKSGEIVDQVDDADLPDDGEDCTDDLCNSGYPAFTALAFGQPCGPAGSWMCDGEGSCVECMVPGDCTGADDECQARTCDKGVCGFVYAPKDTPVALQIPGDCLAQVCDGAGKMVAVPDNGDVPDDGNDCTSDVCSGGFPSNPPATQGTPCGSLLTMTCNDVGQCTGCTAPTDCSGTDDFCRKRTCAAGVCGLDYTAKGTTLPPAEQLAGDCQAKQCDGKGLVEQVASDTDLPPDDGQSCTAEGCAGGVVQHPPLPADTPCAESGGVVCDGLGGCVECNAASQCTASAPCKTPTCAGHACGETNTLDNTPAPPSLQVAGDCKLVVCNGAGGTKSVSQDVDLPVDGNGCTADVCTNGVPSNPPLAKGTSCNDSGGSWCDGLGSCVQCLVDGHCPQGETCLSSGQCSGCVLQTCGSLGLTCGIPPGGDGCGGPLACDDGKQNGGETGVDCGGPTASCPTRCPNGIACQTGSDCDSQNCIDGYCCNSACAGVCQSCALPSKLGACNPIPGDTDPDGECQSPPVKCTGSTLATAWACNGASACKVTATTSCGAYACNAAGTACLTSCSVQTDCVGAYYCNTATSQCVPKLANGTSCVSSSSCLSSYCVDGFCCATPCAGTCMACALAKSGNPSGTCGLIPTATDPDNECPGNGGVDFCVGNGSCGPCGSTPAPPGGSCPAVCNGGCAGNKCLIDCTANNACKNQTKSCPAGFDCQVTCGKSGCSGAVINCPASFVCNVVCQAQTSSCASATINCASGACSLACQDSADVFKPCLGTQLKCGPNKCTASCTGVITAKPTVSCNASCGCTKC